MSIRIQSSGSNAEDAPEQQGEEKEDDFGVRIVPLPEEDVRTSKGRGRSKVLVQTMAR